MKNLRLLNNIAIHFFFVKRETLKAIWLKEICFNYSALMVGEGERA